MDTEPFLDTTVIARSNDDRRIMEDSMSNVTRNEIFKEKVCNHFPITQWLPKYSYKDVFGDFVAGTSVALAAIPQSMAYAILAGLSPQFGLYSSFLAPFVYIFLGSCRQVTIGPTAVSALLAFETCGRNFPDCVVLVSFYSGIIQIVLYLLRIGHFVALISDPVTIGFTNGAALTIASSQLKGFFGFHSSKSTHFLGYWESIFKNWATISIPDAIMGFSCLLALLILQNLKLLICQQSIDSDKRLLKKIFWVLSVCRNVIVVVCASIVAYTWGSTPPFHLTGFVESGLPDVTIPNFCLENRWVNETVTEVETLTFFQTLSKLGFGPSMVALVAILQNVAISKAYGSGQRIDGNQEMLSLGVASIFGGFISAQPVSASFSRSALNDASGVRSQFSGFFTGTIVIISLSALTPTFYYIPKATLAAVIISAVIVLVDFRIIPKMWRINKKDTLTYGATFLSSLLISMEIGIGVGLGVSIFVFLYGFLTAKLIPEFKTDEIEPTIQYIILRPPSGLQFPEVDTLRKYVNHYSLKYSDTHPVIVIDCLKWQEFDFTGVAAVSSILQAAQRNRTSIILLHCSEKLRGALKTSGLSELELLRIICANELSLNQLVRKNSTEITSLIC